MRRILLLLASAAVMTLPAAAAARAQSHSAAPGFLVVRDAFSDAGVAGSPVAKVAVKGFVIGHVAQEGAVEIYHFNSSTVSLGQVSGIDVSHTTVKYRKQTGTKFSGTDFRFRAAGGGVWRVVVYGAGVSLYTGGQAKVKLHGSQFPHAKDGHFSVNGGPWMSMPSGVVTVKLGEK
jgi:hypothetical protein